MLFCSVAWKEDKHRETKQKTNYCNYSIYTIVLVDIMWCMFVVAATMLRDGGHR